jgi:hypothetical protein
VLFLNIKNIIKLNIVEKNGEDIDSSGGLTPMESMFPNIRVIHGVSISEGDEYLFPNMIFMDEIS